MEIIAKEHKNKPSVFTYNTDSKLMKSRVLGNYNYDTSKSGNGGMGGFTDDVVYKA